MPSSFGVADQYAIASVWADKNLIMPYKTTDLNSDGFPDNIDEKSWYFTYQISIQVIDVTTNERPKQPVNIYIEDDQNPDYLTYWASDKKTNITGSVDNDENPTPVQTDENGLLTFYIGRPQADVGLIFDLTVSLDKTFPHGNLTRTQTFSAFIYDPDRINAFGLENTLPPLGFPQWDSSYTFPQWDVNDIDPLTSTKLSTLGHQHVPGSDRVVIAINGKRLDTGKKDYTWNDITTGNGVSVPYSMFKGNNSDIEGFDGNNYITYFVSGSTAQKFLSEPFQFQVTEGLPLQVPDSTVNVDISLNIPIWYGARNEKGGYPKNEPIKYFDIEQTINVVNPRKLGLDILITYPTNVQVGDRYQLFVYVNGYEASGKQVTQVFGDGSPIPHLEENPNLYTWVVDEDGKSQGYSVQHIQDSLLATFWAQPEQYGTTPGMMFFQYVVNESRYSPIYESSSLVPLTFDFSDSANYVGDISSRKEPTNDRGELLGKKTENIDDPKHK